MAELWIDKYPNMIPTDQYSMEMTAGEEKGLIIKLYSAHNTASIDFGCVAGFRVLDEGVLLNSSCHCGDDDSFNAFREAHFPSVIYAVEGGTFLQNIQMSLGPELSEIMHLSQYNIVTMNYLVSVVTQWVPELIVSPIENKREFQ